MIGNALAGANSTRQVIGNIRLIDGFAGALTPNQLAAKMLEYQQAFALDWNPLMIQGLVAWIDPAYATLDGGVDFAPDRSLYGNHFEQTDAGTRLGLDATTAAFNNLPTFTSDGTGFLEEVRTGRLNRKLGNQWRLDQQPCWLGCRLPLPHQRDQRFDPSGRVIRRRPFQCERQDIHSPHLLPWRV